MTFDEIDAHNDSELALSEPFYAPSTDGALDHLFTRRELVKANIEAIAGYMDGPANFALNCFLDAHHVANYSRGGTITADALLKPDLAVAALDASLWQQAMDMTDVMNCMPQERRSDWIEQIRKHATPGFTPENVLPTFEALLSSRAKFLAERVDGLFQSLSRSHVTNQPEGFSKRMILSYVLSEWGGTPNYERVGLLHDLRSVIARFMGRDDPHHNDSSEAIKQAAANAGKWVTIDGGALRMRVYLGVRTGHLEVHPDMAWRLNAVLASLHPAAIPSQFREPPKRKVRDFALMQKPLPFEVIGLLRELVGKGDSRKLSYGTKPDKAQSRRLGEVLAAIGAIESAEGWQFDYDPADVLREIIVSGCIPDAVSHQFYPTPEHIARAAVEAAQIRPEHRVLEPSAGLGGIADHLPTERTCCVEISAMHCAVLRAKGLWTESVDFLQWQSPSGAFDRVVMNPPYSEGRWHAHVDHAASMVRSGGRLVAILPESARRKRLLRGWNIQWSETHKFPGTSIEVVILTADKEIAA